MQNDYKNPNRYPQDPNNNIPPQRDDAPNMGLWLVVGMVAAVALVAVFAFRGDGVEMPAASPATTAAIGTSPNEIEPAEGDAFRDNQAATTAAPNDTPDAVSDAAPPVVTTNPVQTTESIHTYASEEECAAATAGACHYITCDSVPGGKQPDEACGPTFQTGWQPVVPAPNKTAVPEEIAPPLSGQGNAPTETPPLTGQ